MFNTSLEKLSNGQWRFTVSASSSTFSTGVSAYDLGLKFDPTKAQLTNPGITLAGEFKQVNNTQLANGLLVVTSISSNPITSITPLGVFDFSNVANDQLLVGLNRLEINGVGLASSNNIYYTNSQRISGQSFSGGAGADRWTSGGGSDTINGGAGLDTVSYTGRASGYAVYSSSSGAVVTDLATGAQDTLTGVERLQFSDKSFALDMSGAAGKAYRVYKAAFNRDPMQGDTAGLGFWVSRIDAGMDMVEVGARFIDSNEFRSLYGSNPSNADFLTRVYQNVLGRTPDAGGYNWWLNEMNTNASKTKAKILADFAESPENQSNVAALVGSGVFYDVFSG